MAKNTQFSPLFRSPSGKSPKEKGESFFSNLPWLKALVGLLVIILVVQIYHHRKWFVAIPENAGDKTAHIKKTAVKPSPEPVPVETLKETPENDRPGFFKSIFSALTPSGNVPQSEIFRLDARFDSLFENLGVKKTDVRRTVRDFKQPFLEEKVKLPRGRPLPEYTLAVVRMLEKSPYRVSDVFEKTGKDTTVTIEVKKKRSTIRKVVLSFSGTYFAGSARAALVALGFGDNINAATQALLSGIHHPLTLGIAPHKKHAWQVAEVAQKNGWEVVCQIPLESVPFKNLGELAIYKHFDAEKTRFKVQEMGLRLPAFKGYSIFGQGTRIMESETEILKSILQEAQKEDRYFLDISFATHSQARNLAHSLGMKSLSVLGFVGTPRNTRFPKMAPQAFPVHIKKTGEGVLLFQKGAGILATLKKTIARLDAQNIKIVPLSSLYK